MSTSVLETPQVEELYRTLEQKVRALRPRKISRRSTGPIAFRPSSTACKNVNRANLTSHTRWQSRMFWPTCRWIW